MEYKTTCSINILDGIGEIKGMVNDDCVIIVNNHISGIGYKVAMSRCFDSDIRYAAAQAKVIAEVFKALESILETPILTNKL